MTSSVCFRCTTLLLCFLFLLYGIVDGKQVTVSRMKIHHCYVSMDYNALKFWRRKKYFYFKQICPKEGLRKWLTFPKRGTEFLLTPTKGGKEKISVKNGLFGFFQKRMYVGLKYAHENGEDAYRLAASTNPDELDRMIRYDTQRKALVLIRRKSFPHDKEPVLVPEKIGAQQKGAQDVTFQAMYANEGSEEALHKSFALEKVGERTTEKSLKKKTESQKELQALQARNQKQDDCRSMFRQMDHKKEGKVSVNAYLSYDEDRSLKPKYTPEQKEEVVNVFNTILKHKHGYFTEEEWISLCMKHVAKSD